MWPHLENNNDRRTCLSSAAHLFYLNQTLPGFYGVKFERSSGCFLWELDIMEGEMGSSTNEVLNVESGKKDLECPLDFIFGVGLENRRVNERYIPL